MKKIIFFLFFFLYFAKGVFADEVFEGEVVNIIDEGVIIESDLTRYPYQKLEVLVKSGSRKGEKLTVQHGQFRQVGLTLYKTGDNVMLSSTGDANQTVLITDYIRRTPLIVLASIFFILTIIVGGKRGFMAILGMLITFILLFTSVLPMLIDGHNPFLVVGIFAAFVIPITFLLSHGFNKKTFCAIAGTFTALIISSIFAHVFIEASRLTGFASEEAGFLEILRQGAIDIKGLLFAGIVIALLGILEDITISQSAIVFSLREANHRLSIYELFRRGMNVGRDHIASMANTLILVYAGASLPLLLLFIISPLPFTSVINNEVIAEEIIRTFVASIGLILAVPITTFISAIYAKRD